MPDTKLGALTLGTSAELLASPGVPFSMGGTNPAKRATAAVARQAFAASGEYHVDSFAGADDDAKLAAALAACYAANGGVIVFAARKYTLNNQIILPVDGSTPARMPSIKFKGQGCYWSGQGHPGFGVTALDMRNTTALGKLIAKGLGLFEAEGITFMDDGTSSNPFIFTTNCTLHIHDCAFLGNPTKANATCDQDAIVCGGTSTTLGNGDNAPFQGYGTVIERNYFNRIRRGLFGRTYFNANRFVNNTFWNLCGSNLSRGVAIELDGDVGGTTQYATGNVIANNLIEVPGYVFGIKARMAAMSQILCNDCYDGTITTLGAVLLQDTCVNSTVMASLGPAGLPYLVDESDSGQPGKDTVLITTDGLAKLPALKSGNAATPNNFGNTVFTGTSAQTTIQPATSQGDNSVLLQAKRSAAEASDAGANVWKVLQNGGIFNGNPSAAQQGNITTTLDTATSWSNNGRRWACNGSGGAMEQHSGSGGSYYKAYNFSFQFYTQGAVLVGEIGPVYGGGGFEGIGFGTAKDVALYRSQDDTFGVTGVIVDPNFLVAGLPTVNAGKKGARAFATNGRKLGELAAAGTGCPVWCDGTAWRTYYDNTVVAA